MRHLLFVGCVLSMAGCGDGAATTRSAAPADAQMSGNSPASVAGDAVRQPSDSAPAARYRAQLAAYIAKSDVVLQVLETSNESEAISREVKAVRQLFTEFPDLPPEDVEPHQGLRLKSQIREHLRTMDTLFGHADLHAGWRRIGVQNAAHQKSCADAIQYSIAEIRVIIGKLEQAAALPRRPPVQQVAERPALSPDQAISSEKDSSTLVWGSSHRKLLRYQVEIAELQFSALPKFSGERHIAITLDLQLSMPQGDVQPAFVRVHRYRSHQKDGDGFAVSLDSNPDAMGEADESFAAALSELCQRVYPIAIAADSSLLKYPAWSTDSRHSHATSDQFGGDLTRAVDHVLVPVDGGPAIPPRSWRLTSAWDELRETVVLESVHEFRALTAVAGSRQATVRFRGAGKQDQGGNPPYTAEVETEGEYVFDVSHRRLVSLSAVETLKTNDVFNTSQTRRMTITLVSAGEQAAAAPGDEFPNNEPLSWPLRKRTLIPGQTAAPPL